MTKKQNPKKANLDLQGFISEERKRVIAPGPYFAARVMARLNAAKESGERSGRLAAHSIWEMLPGGTRPVFALSLMFLLAFAVIHVALPVEPVRGPIEAVVTADMEDHPEGFLFTGTQDVPTSDEFLDIVKDDQ